MDNIYDYLKADHDKVANLFKLFEKAPSYEAKNEYVDLIIKELLIHAESEQDTFYQELEKHRESQDEVFHGEKEHAEIVDKINEILASPHADEVWEEKVIELKKLVEHHVSEEEGAIFKRAKKVLSDKEAYIIREQMHDRKEKILTRLEKELDKGVPSKASLKQERVD